MKIFFEKWEESLPDIHEKGKKYFEPITRCQAGQKSDAPSRTYYAYAFKYEI